MKLIRACWAYCDEANVLVAVLGYDIGGANTKAAVVHVDDDKVQTVTVEAEYFPVWKQSKELSSVLLALKERLKIASPDAVGVTMTAELSDAYQTKREGVHHILSCVKEAFPTSPIEVLSTNAELLSIEAALESPLDVASANWAATGWLVAQQKSNAVVVDVGSTSTSIIPIVNGKLAAQGKTDVNKLVCGELVYTGSLRTNVAAIVQSIPLESGVAGVSSELFALSGDVHVVLGNIAEADYTSETADGRGKTVPEAMARLARVVCADIDMLSEDEIHDIAVYIYREQIRQIADDLKRSIERVKTLTQEPVAVVVTGLGKEFLARRAAEELEVDEILDLDALVPRQAVYASPAVAVALMAANKTVGANLAWTSRF
ncbi:MAG: H4MPT-linked C1 transfer pathway protein [Candidatus Bathyarchaeota archaeon]|nr:H4MPT-linked C1 transfer pathway protein [Candidatus Bathyarchaeota archaeon]